MNLHLLKPALGVITAVILLTLHLPAHGEETKEAQRNKAAVDLGIMEVEGKRQELALRMIKLAYERNPSNRAEDLDKVVCWVDKKKGSHLNYLFCGTNRARYRMGRSGQASFNELVRTFVPKSGGPREPMVAPPSTDDMIFRSDQPVTEGQIQALTKRLGPSALNREIVEDVTAGGSMPESLPDQEELDAFLDAYQSVKQIRQEFDPRIRSAAGDEHDSIQEKADRQMIAAIRDAGLTLERYNHIAGLSERYKSLKHYMRQRLAAND